jgi:hypothetical protein
MNEAHFLQILCYPIQFCKSEAEAVANLKRLIVGKQCGLDQGVPFYVSHITSIVEREPGSFPEIPNRDFPFGKSQLKTLLSALRDALTRSNLN